MTAKLDRHQQSSALPPHPRPKPKRPSIREMPPVCAVQLCLLSRTDGGEHRPTFRRVPARNVAPRARESGPPRFPICGRSPQSTGSQVYCALRRSPAEAAVRREAGARIESASGTWEGRGPGTRAAPTRGCSKAAKPGAIRVTMQAPRPRGSWAVSH